MARIPPTMASGMKVNPDNQMQGKKSGQRSPLSNDIWQLLRTINLDNCTDTVLLRVSF